MKKILSLVLLLVSVSSTLITLTAPARQIHPDKQRTVEIQQALIAKGYMFGSPSGVWDNQTIDILRQIAESHKWQVIYVPDARVLGMLGLGSKRFNPVVIDMTNNHLDQLERHEQ